MARTSRSCAVLFADVSESGALYQRLGDVAARALVNGCIESLGSVLPRHGGERVKTMGDAILCVFPTADAAVLAAIEMQSLVSGTRPGVERVRIHVGLHYGSVLCENGDVFGDTVNVAAYLTAAAMREQILTTEATYSALSEELKSSVRPVFSAVLKGSGRESLVYQVLWKADGGEITELNLGSSRIIPADMGKLLVTFGEVRMRIDQWRPMVRLGRSAECDLVLKDAYASRQHSTLRARGTRFYLIDHSINGTYVSFSDGTQTRVLRGELLLDRSGALTMGRPPAADSAEVVRFEYDRRSMYRP